MQPSEHNTPVTLSQILYWVAQCSVQEKQVLLRKLIDETAALTLASEPSLGKDWDTAEEDEAWKEL